MNSVELKHKLLSRLVMIRDLGPRFHNSGICSNVIARATSHLQKALKIELRELFRRWPNIYVNSRTKMKDEDYPVGGLYEYRDDVYHRTVWDNALRIELLNWLIAELTKELIVDGQE